MTMARTMGLTTTIWIWIETWLGAAASLEPTTETSDIHVHVQFQSMAALGRSRRKISGTFHLGLPFALCTSRFSHRLDKRAIRNQNTQLVGSNFRFVVAACLGDVGEGDLRQLGLWRESVTKLPVFDKRHQQICTFTTHAFFRDNENGYLKYQLYLL